MDDHLTDLNPCPLCGSAEGYKLLEGSTFRWWQVVCAACGERVTECRSDPGVRWDRVPSSHPNADAAWQGATKHYAAVLARVAALDAENAALRADAERLDYIASHARCDPKMCGNHVWWPTNFKHRLIGPTLRAAIDAAREARDE